MPSVPATKPQPSLQVLAATQQHGGQGAAPLPTEEPKATSHKSAPQTCTQKMTPFPSPQHNEVWRLNEEEDKYAKGGQKKRFKDTLKATLKGFSIDTNPFQLYTKTDFCIFTS